MLWVTWLIKQLMLFIFKVHIHISLNNYIDVEGSAYGMFGFNAQFPKMGLAETSKCIIMGCTSFQNSTLSHLCSHP